MRTARSIPEYTTILGQAMSPCGSWYVAATTTGQLAVWSLAGLVAGEGQVAPSARQGSRCEITEETLS